MRPRPSAALLLWLALAGCANLSGLDGGNSFACKAPAGVRCESMSGIYANARQAQLPGQPARPAAGAAEGMPQLSFARVLGHVPDSGTPLRSAPRVLRLWFAPWEDTDGDLHDQSYVYLQLDAGHWLIEHNRRRIEERFRPVHAPAAAAASMAAASLAPAQPTAPGLENIGTLQVRPPAAEAAVLLDGMATPARPTPP